MKLNKILKVKKQIMKNSIRTRFTMGMIFLFLIILVLSVFSGYYLNKLTGKTSAILKENYLSVVYAREMSEGIMSINNEITISFLTGRNSDSVKVIKELSAVNKSLLEEKENITEPGEDNLVSDIETEYTDYKDSVLSIIKYPLNVKGMIYLQDKSGVLYEKLLHLSQMNGNAIQLKTDEARSYSKRALTQMTILATLCFLIGVSFIFSFASYFSQRFFQLYNGIKEIVSSNFDQHLFFNGNDEFYEISKVFNEMADKLKENKQKMSVTLPKEKSTYTNSDYLDELKKMMSRIKIIEQEASELISKIEKK
jgi:NtrC-family two-component system sensor histidine kinase KinB